MNFTSLLLKWRVYLLVLSLLSSSFIHSSPTSTDSSSSTFIYQNDLCFINAISSHHYHLILGYLYSIQLLYPCIHMYIYDLGLNTQQRAFLNSLPYLTLLKFTNNGHPYYHNGVILFKPAMILNFIDLYASLHRCRYFFYSHSNAILHKKFDISVWNELLSTGLVVERELKEYQYQVTSPQMYSYFNLSYHHDRQSVLPIRQIYSGLILIETTNSTLYENIWKKWADCIFNPLCINIPTNTTSSSPETTYTLSAAQFEQPSTSSSRSSSHSQPSHKHNINR